MLPLLAFHIILLFIALVTFVAVCREAVSSRRLRSFFVKLEPRGTRPMPWIQPEQAVPKGPHGGEVASAQNIRCDLCSWETVKAFWGPNSARAEAGVYWPKPEEAKGKGKGEPSWCPRCASRESQRAISSYYHTSLDVESVMSEHWRAPTGRAVVRGNTVAKAPPGPVPPKAPPPAFAEDGLTREALSRHDYLEEQRPSAPPPRNTVAEAPPGRVPPKAFPPGIPSLVTEERLAALEEELANLRLRVAELEEYLGGAATRVVARPPP